MSPFVVFRTVQIGGSMLRFFLILKHTLELEKMLKGAKK